MTPDRKKKRLDDAAEQARLHAAAAKFVGALSLGAGPYTNEAVRKRIRQRLAQKHGRKLPR
jgi:hypothetical protein